MEGQYRVIAECVLMILIVWVIYIVQKTKKLKLEKVPLEQINKGSHCLIDIRDFITSSHQPVVEAENIPLSYLKRRAKSKEICDKKVVLITDDLKAAKIAAKIIKKTKENQHCFYYVLQ